MRTFEVTGTAMWPRKSSGHNPNNPTKYAFTFSCAAVDTASAHRMTIQALAVLYPLMETSFALSDVGPSPVK